MPDETEQPANQPQSSPKSAMPQHNGSANIVEVNVGEEITIKGGTFIVMSYGNDHIGLAPKGAATAVRGVNPSED